MSSSYTMIIAAVGNAVSLLTAKHKRRNSEIFHHPI